MSIQNFVDQEMKIFRQINPKNLKVEGERLRMYLSRVERISGLDFDTIQNLWKSQKSFYLFWDEIHLKKRG